MYYFLGFFAAFIAVVAQLFLKTEADAEHKSFLSKFLNIRVILSYGIMMVSMLLNVVAQQQVSLKVYPIMDASGFLWVPLLSFIFLKEKISKRRLLAIGLVFIGIIVFSADAFLPGV